MPPTGLVNLVPALAIMLGANVGTSLIVQVLSFNVSALAPILLVVGVVAFRRGARTRVRDLGRVAIGLGLMLLALHILIDSLAPAETAPTLRELLAAVTGQPAMNVLIGALLTWAVHSSVAVILLVMSLSYSNFVAPVAALALVLGANLGSALNPVFEAGSRDDPATRRLPYGNLLTRIVGCMLFLPLLSPIERFLSQLDPNPVRLAADFHIAFNVVIAALFLSFLGAVARLLAIIDRNLMELAAKKLKRKLSFSREGAAELDAIYKRVLESLKLSFGIFLSGDVKVARQLLEQKTHFREAEIAAADSHLARLREGRPESVETSSLHLDVLRDLKRIHSHICAAAYAALEAVGELQSSRLKSWPRIGRLRGRSSRS